MEDDDLFWRCVLEGYTKTDVMDYRFEFPIISLV